MNTTNEQKGNYYIIADHLRTTIFALADGAKFGPKGRGYILKKLVKKATLLGYLLHLSSEHLQKISEKLIEVNSSYYQHLVFLIWYQRYFPWINSFLFTKK
jgi:alanyl-tRNA synthetase